ncbi:ROK family transcriptional regulator [Streptomyces sp. VRA16 Mangrove soil]|uniref:ROK family transcriptional regulator n=1 Tax=Streptomyces sp. VRA16 Mangrove soil TaxID=2817434 RepID=UPI001A9CF19B|nr:ROK family transcriptional regulator [Streptomyces sp. VRA16 Mangrove soil]MBO1336375.1 ROK family transcriptional regulator [Streptomyces sp. VRA16 Mangrove soil]
MKSNLAPPQAKADKATVRRHNLSLVLRAVHDEGETTRAAVAARSGLTRAAVSSLVEQLLSSGFLTESGKTFSGHAGRPGTVLKVARTGFAGVGVEINIDYITVCVVDLAGMDRVRLTEHLDNRGTPPADVLARAARITSQALGSAAAQELVPAGAHLALPGLISGGTVRQAPNLGWSRVAAEGIFAQALSTLRRGGRGGTAHALPVSSGNEADAAALAELWFGEADEARRRSFLYLTGEIGVGGALVLNGELLRGAHGFAGEIGHVVVDEGGPLCRCGSRGCLEQYAGQAALLRTAGIAEDAGQPGVAELERRAVRGDERAVAAIAEAGRTLGLVLSGAVNLIDPDAIVLGGTYRPLLPWLARPIDECLERRVVSGLWTAGSGKLRAASAAGDAARGSAAQVVRDVMGDPQAYAERVSDAGGVGGTGG